jgi:hypothetical protein
VKSGRFPRYFDSEFMVALFFARRGVFLAVGPLITDPLITDYFASARRSLNTHFCAILSPWRRHLLRW